MACPFQIGKSSILIFHGSTKRESTAGCDSDFKELKTRFFHGLRSLLSVSFVACLDGLKQRFDPMRTAGRPLLLTGYLVSRMVSRNCRMRSHPVFVLWRERKWRCGCWHQSDLTAAMIANYNLLQLLRAVSYNSWTTQFISLTEAPRSVHSQCTEGGQTGVDEANDAHCCG